MQSPKYYINTGCTRIYECIFTIIVTVVFIYSSITTVFSNRRSTHVSLTTDAKSIQSILLHPCTDVIENQSVRCNRSKTISTMIFLSVLVYCTISAKSVMTKAISDVPALLSKPRITFGSPVGSLGYKFTQNRNTVPAKMFIFEEDKDKE